MLVQKPWPHELSSIISSNASAAAEYISWCDACFLPDDSLVGVADNLLAHVHWDAQSRNPRVLAQDLATDPNERFVDEPRISASREYIAHGTT